jgi:hypothetical protein
MPVNPFEIIACSDFMHPADPRGGPNRFIHELYSTCFLQLYSPAKSALTGGRDSRERETRSNPGAKSRGRQPPPPGKPRPSRRYHPARSTHAVSQTLQLTPSKSRGGNNPLHPTDGSTSVESSRGPRACTLTAEAQGRAACRPWMLAHGRSLAARRPDTSVSNAVVG